ncbi:MAG TPA: cytidine deaminase [Pirellulales bacterium]|jgi:cytidine deaminase
MLSDAEKQSLIQAACDVRQRAHCDYSNFQVGAALLTKSGKTYAGCNVENISYGLTICAERSTVCAAVAAGDGQPREKNNWVAMVVVGKGEIWPCGACRQVIAEFAPKLPMILVDADKVGSGPVDYHKLKAVGGVVESDMNQLLPHQFQFDFLKKKP